MKMISDRYFKFPWRKITPTYTSSKLFWRNPKFSLTSIANYYSYSGILFLSSSENVGVQEIAAAEGELERCLHTRGGGTRGKASTNVAVEAAALSEEIDILNSRSPDGLVQDDQINYFLSVGLVENSIKDLRMLKELNQMNERESSKNLASEKSEIQNLTRIIEGLEKEIGDNEDIEFEDKVKKMNLDKREELVKNNRMNKMILRNMKSELRNFIDDTGSLDSDYSESRGSGVGLYHYW